MKNMPEITDDELRSIMYALTLGERPRTRERWLKKGFKKIHKRGENALFNYWRRRIEANEADLKYALRERITYFERISSAGRPTQPPPNTPPNLPQMAASFGNSVLNFARNGFTTTDSETLAAREEICRGCEFWDSEALNGTGRCRKCGCATWAKLRMATEKCPIGKW